MNRILASILLTVAVFWYWLSKDTDTSVQDFQRLKQPIVVVSIDHSCQDSASYGDVMLSGGNNLTLTFAGESDIAKSVRNRYIEGDTIKLDKNGK